MYRRMLHGFVRRTGLDAAAADEVVQEIMIVAAKAMPGFKYQPERCSFKGWLLNLARYRLADHFRKLHRQVPLLHPGSSLHSEEYSLENLPSPSAFPSAVEWELEWQERLAETALERVKELTSPLQFQMFHLYVVKHWPAAKVASTVNVSRGSVYLAKFRVGALLKKEVRTLKARFE